VIGSANEALDRADISMEELNRVVLPNEYPQVYQIQNFYPFNSHGWYGHHVIFKNLISKDTHLAVEVGSWLGASARDIAQMLPEESLLFCVDTWLGSEEHQSGQVCYSFPIDSLFDRFLSNVIHSGLQKKIIPVKLTSIEAAKRFQSLGIKFDFIYIDAAHDYDSIKRDIEAWYPLLEEGGVFCGDDFHYPPIIRAVGEFAKKYNLEMVPASASCWLLRKQE